MYRILGTASATLTWIFLFGALISIPKCLGIGQHVIHANIEGQDISFRDEEEFAKKEQAAICRKNTDPSDAYCSRDLP